MRRFHKILLSFFGLLLITACTTQKRKGDVGKLKKFYHNTTAEFNGYFNANELYQESIIQLNEQHQDNYNKVLPVFEYVAADNPKAVAGNLDAAIEKVTIVKALHEVSDWVDDCYLLMGQAQFVKQDYESAEETLEYLKAEYNPEAMAKKARKGKKGKKKKKKRKSTSKKKKNKKKKASSKSRKKKRKAANKAAKKRKKGGKKKKNSSAKEKTDKSAEESGRRKKKPTDATENTTKQESTSKKSKKKKEADDSLNLSEADSKGAKAGLLKRPPAFQEGRLWLARTYIEREKYDEAQEILASLGGDPNTLATVKRQLPPVMAHYYLKQKNYDLAIRPLEQAISTAKKKQDKARYAYILAQLHQLAGRGEASFTYFEKSGNWSDSYEMRFSAKLNMVKSDYVNGRATVDEVTKDLEKMTKDIKNEEYRDQIYFALADIALKRDRKPEAITYLKKSLNYSTGNTAQSAEAYYLLADLYFEEQDFVNAKYYFDSTLQVLPKTDERYDQVSNYSKNLTEIAANIVIIQEQDSLLTISKMSDKDKEALAYQIQKKNEQDRINNLRAAANKPDDKFKGRSRASAAGGPGSRSSAGGGSPSSFFAYNEKTLKKGGKEFDKKWDNRALEDNWRRSNRRGGGNLEEEFAVEETPSGILSEEDIKNLLKDVPNTPEAIKAAEQKIADAMFALGSLYRDRLERNNKTVEVLEDLNDRFPSNTHELDSWYLLYLAHTDLGNATKARFYHDKIVDKYPQTTYARVLLDPNFLETSKEEERRLNTYYNQTFLSFETGKYQDVTQRVVKAVEMFGPANSLQPRFALLNAMSQGNLQGKDAYVKELRSIISTYPNTPEQKRAREILRLLGSNNTTVADKEKVGGENKKTESEVVFKVDDNKMHYVLVTVDNPDIAINDIKNSLSNYHKEFHKLDKLRIAPVYIGTLGGDKRPVMVVRRFKSKALAMEYFDGASKNGDAFLPAGSDFGIYPITQYNYRQVLKKKDLEGYKKWFAENY